MLSTERQPEVGNLLVDFDGWQVHEMLLTPAKVEVLWQMFKRFPTLFSDLTAGDKDNFVAMLSQPHTFWMEVYEDDKMIGLLYLMHLDQVIDADVHILFFDRQTNNKIALCREVLRWVFKRFRMHRVSSSVPDIYYATIRLAEKVGMKREGVRRESILLGGKWCDEIQFGLLATELD